MTCRSVAVCVALGLAARAAHAQEPNTTRRRSQQYATAVRVSEGSIRVDGHLDDEGWRNAVPSSDFVQREPTEGAAPTERTDVRFAYDDEALYVGAQMQSPDGAVIQAPLGRRDSVDTQSEYFLISLDTFLDGRTAYTLGVSASGVRLDRFHPRDDETTVDNSYDPVWDAQTSVAEGGWTAEFRIPFSQLRFNSRPVQVWGLQMRRYVPTREEQDDWVLIPRTVRAWSSAFGQLRGIESLRPTRRLEVMPVVVGSSTVNTDRDPRNPFDDGRNLSGRPGGDMKMGLGPSLTLSVTVNPDFAQVEADAAEVNLTAFPTRFPEKRPFFTEGAQLLTSIHNQTFYSRRIGAGIPRPSGDFVDAPTNATILAAGKVTGRLPSRTSIGILSAVTDREVARIKGLSAGTIQDVPVAAQAIYNIAKVQQEFGRNGSTASGWLATVHRNMAAGDPMANLVTRDALMYAGEAIWRFKGGQYEMQTSSVGTLVTGDAPAIERIQRASAHYFQRPDAPAGRFDPTRTSLSGYSSMINIARTSGRHWLFDAEGKIDSLGFEANDLANLTRAEGFEPNGNITYRETRPGKIFRSYSIGLSPAAEWDFSGHRQNASLPTAVNVTWANFWTSAVTVRRTLSAQDWSLTRGGPIMAGPATWSIVATAGNRASAQTRLTTTVTNTRNDLGGSQHRATATFSFRPRPRWQLSAAPVFDRTEEAQQYVTTLGGGRPETYGSRYVFANISRKTMSAQLRLGFTLKPDLNLDVYAEPFAASGRYFNFGELLMPGTNGRLAYGSNGTTAALTGDGRRVVNAGASTFTLKNYDFNTATLNSNVVLRWEWRQGSTMYVVWQQNRTRTDPFGTGVGLGDVFGSFGAPGVNVILVKASFWVPVS